MDTDICKPLLNLHRVDQPFSYGVMDNFFRAGLADRLRDSFPMPLLKIDEKTPENTSLHHYFRTERELNEARFLLTEEWQQVVEQFLSERFFMEIREVFHEPMLLALAGAGFDHSADEIQFINGEFTSGIPQVRPVVALNVITPASSGDNIIRGSHLDKPDKLFTVLLYLKDVDEGDSGAHLSIARWTSNVNMIKRILYREGVPALFARETSVIEYAHNKLVVILNSIDSLHAVTLRHPTPHNRLVLKLHYECNFELFRRAPGNQIETILNKIMSFVV